MSNPKPAITFKVNLETPSRQSHLMPNRTETAGNETTSEANNQKDTRWMYIPGLNPGSNYYGGFPSQLKHNSTFVEYGLKAIYLKNLYATGLPDALLSVVSTDWDA